MRPVTEAVRAGVVAAALTGGTAAVLVAVTGSPLSHDLPTLGALHRWLVDPWQPGIITVAVTAAVWLLWSTVTAVLTAVTCARLARQVRMPRLARVHLRLPGPVQSLHAALLGVTAVSTTTVLHPDTQETSATAATTEALDVTQVTDGGRGSLGLRPAAVAQLTEHTPPAPRVARPRDHQPPAPDRAARAGTYRVTAGDTLWDIAERRLGRPTRWRDIYTLNRGHKQANGSSLTDPDEIHIGWVLALPAHDADPAPAAPTPADPAPADAGPATGDPAPTHCAPGSTGAAEPTPGDATRGPVTPAPSATTTAPSSAAPTPEASARATPADSGAPSAEVPDKGKHSEAGGAHGEAGISLPSQGWVNLGLVALIATVASLLRLQRRRRARLAFPIRVRVEAQPAPVPEPLARVDAVGTGRLRTEDEVPHRPPVPAVACPIGVDPGGAEVSLFDLPGPGVALTGPGAEPAARAVLATVLATGTTAPVEKRPVVVTTLEIAGRLLPAGAPLVGLDPDGTSFDGERLIVLPDAAAAVTHAEEEMIIRRRVLDTFNLDTVTALNARTDHAEMQPPYVLLIEATARHAARLLAVGAHRAALDLHPVVLGPLDGLPTVEVAADGTTTDGGAAARVARLTTFAAGDLAAVLAMLTDATARPEAGYDVELDLAPSSDTAAPVEAPAEPVPAQASDAPALVRLRVLGPLVAETDAGPVTSGMRSGSYVVLASLAVHPTGRTLEQLAADLHPDTDLATAGNRIRTDVSTTRRVLRAATGNPEAMFVIYDGATGRYRLDPEMIAVDLWQMLTAIEAANTADDDAQALALLREAVELYGGDFADGADQTWINDYTTSYRHQILSAYARIAELLEADRPDEAVAALERALEFDPVNEELYQRIMRIHGRLNRPDVVRRTLRRLEERLADLGDAEPSQATRRVAQRQLRPTNKVRG